MGAIHIGGHYQLPHLDDAEKCLPITFDLAVVPRARGYTVNNSDGAFFIAGAPRARVQLWTRKLCQVLHIRTA